MWPFLRGSNETARIHRWVRCYDSVAACGTRAAKVDAGDRLSQRRIPAATTSLRGGISRGTEGNRGFIAGENLAIEYRWAEERYDRLPPDRNLIFVVDDDPGTLRGVSRLLRQYGYDSVLFPS